MENCTESNELLSAVGPKEINDRSGIKLEERWTDEEGANRVEQINDFYAMGQNLKLNSVPEVVDTLTIRDYPDLYKYNGKKRLGAIIVPDSYNPAKPTMVHVDKDKLPQERTKNDFKDAVGDMAERSVYEVVKATFTHKKFKGSVLVIQGLNMLSIDPKKRRQKHDREMDFLIIHKELSCVINIEVKNFLGKLQRKKIKQQLIENHQFFEDWFGSDISSKWTWISMVYSEQAFPEDLKGEIAALSRNDFIASGPSALKEKLLKILSRPLINTPISDFKLISKYLLFCSPAKPLPIGMNQVTRMKEAMKKQGSLENIKVWCFPTPEQRAILHHDRVLFLAAWGTGKTLLMQSKAIELTERGESVLFLVYQNEPIQPSIDLTPQGPRYGMNTKVYKSEVPSLLVLQLQLKLRKYEKIKVAPFTKEDILRCNQIGKGFKHVMIDEFPGDVSIFSKEEHETLIGFVSKKKVAWLSLSGNSNPRGGNEYDDAQLDLINEAWFPNCNFKVARMKIPLRSPKKILDMMSKSYKEIGNQSSSLNRFLLTSSVSPPTLTQGKITRIKLEKTSSMTEYLRHCLADIPKGESSILILQRKNSKPMTPCDHCKHRVVSELIYSAFIQLGEKEPIFYTNEFCSAKEDIENWLNQGGSGRHLVVSSNLALGFEHSTVINFADMSTSSRSSGHLITTEPQGLSLSYLALPIYEYLEADDHDCRYLFFAGLDTPLNIIGKII